MVTPEGYPRSYLQHPDFHELAATVEYLPRRPEESNALWVRRYSRVRVEKWAHLMESRGLVLPPWDLLSSLTLHLAHLPLL
jgi:hypothetical protein